MHTSVSRFLCGQVLRHPRPQHIGVLLSVRCSSAFWSHLPPPGVALAIWCCACGAEPNRGYGQESISAHRAFKNPAPAPETGHNTRCIGRVSGGVLAILYGFFEGGQMRRDLRATAIVLVQQQQQREQFTAHWILQRRLHTFCNTVSYTIHFGTNL